MSRGSQVQQTRTRQAIERRNHVRSDNWVFCGRLIAQQDRRNHVDRVAQGWSRQGETKEWLRRKVMEDFLALGRTPTAEQVAQTVSQLQQLGSTPTPVTVQLVPDLSTAFQSLKDVYVSFKHFSDALNRAAQAMSASIDAQHDRMRQALSDVTWPADLFVDDPGPWPSDDSKTQSSWNTPLVDPWSDEIRSCRRCYAKLPSLLEARQLRVFEPWSSILINLCDDCKEDVDDKADSYYKAHSIEWLRFRHDERQRVLLWNKDSPPQPKEWEGDTRIYERIKEAQGVDLTNDSDPGGQQFRRWYQERVELDRKQGGGLVDRAVDLGTG